MEKDYSSFIVIFFKKELVLLLYIEEEMESVSIISFFVKGSSIGVG